METLPPELLYHIIEYIPPIQNLKITRCVSKTWNQIVMVDRQCQTISGCVVELNKNILFRSSNPTGIEIYNDLGTIGTINILNGPNKFLFSFSSKELCGTIVRVKGKTYSRLIDKSTNLDDYETKVKVTYEHKFCGHILKSIPIDQKIVKMLITLLLHIQ